MTESQFVYWLQGFIELSETAMPSLRQWQMIKDHLGLVFTKVTPDYNKQTLPGGPYILEEAVNPLVDEAPGIDPADKEEKIYQEKETEAPTPNTVDEQDDWIKQLTKIFEEMQRKQVEEDNRKWWEKQYPPYIPNYPSPVWPNWPSTTEPGLPGQPTIYC